ncbi:NdufA6 NADH-ubiquinone oxidoreductase 14.8 kDa subunit [Suillus paluster]|uniref:NdufA6 NADH-ubiquinone oxidoreductase 14.8 kDa subunit n=1 Tax=Suillus paluster TaxID=48578 RepID=UPI001B86F0CA|nr:NdufA6 NADH-ubiquinone oxidoreductase 14.8 kDa subunit [Suillus paluster]KAG1732686.1 NdufA6 NADH-ubiquinone oxidoreductase 14.8 kDa subunit [Suillus paluster]
MTTIPSRLAQVTRISSSRADARLRVIDLYRGWVRAAPEICTLYALSVTPAYVRHCIRQKFEQNRHVTDPRAIEVLLLKGQQELQETVNCWKQTDHIYGILLKNQERPQRTFLQKFYEGRDEDVVLPAASGVV